MGEWSEQDPNKMCLVIEDIYMMARMKRAQRHHYDSEGSLIGLVGPKSDDPDWDRIIEFCERAGIRSSILRTMSARSK